MVRRLLALVAAFALAIGFSVSAFAGGGQAPTGNIAIMKHACPENIKNIDDFNALGSFLNQVLTCPVVTRPGDNGPAGAVNGGHVDFNFTVRNSAGYTYTLDDAKFMPAKLCETDLKTDVNGDGKVSADTCVDISHYVISGVAKGKVTITESQPPAGHMFGALLFTPQALGANQDANTLVSASNGTIVLDTTKDNDDTVMLHVYNFKTGMPSTGAGGMANNSNLPVAGMALGLSMLVGLGALGTLALRRR